MNLLDTLKQAREALGGLSYADQEGRGVVMPERWMVTRAKEAITNLTAAIKQMEKQESIGNVIGWEYDQPIVRWTNKPPAGTLLYSAPTIPEG